MKKKIREYIKQFFLIDDTPHKIAAGAALGVFLGIVPGEGVLATIVLSSLFRFNRLAALAGVGASNMWSTLLVFPPAAAVGGWLFVINSEILRNNFSQTYNAGWKYFWGKAVFFDLTLPLIVGFLIVAGLVAIGFYAVILYLLIKKKHLQKDAHLLEKK